MKQKKAVKAALLAMMLAAAVPQIVWGAGKTPVKTTATKAAQTDHGYEFVSGNTRIVLNQEASTVLKALGKAKQVFEQESCAYQGKDTIYSYEDFELATYPVNQKECIASVYFLTDQVSTEEGIHIGSSYSDMVKAYGSKYKMENEVYRYEKNGTELAFYMTNRKIDAIEYTLTGN